MLLVFTPTLTNRIGYTLHVVLGHLLHTPFEITTNADTFAHHADARLCYGPERIVDNCVWIKSANLLFRSTVEDQEPTDTERSALQGLFPVYGRNLDFDFDLLAATFFLVSRYEEYLPHHTDEHGRYKPEESVAYRNGFLQEPVVDRWALMLRRKIEEVFPLFRFAQRPFQMEVTVDIDAAYCYRGKGWWRSFVGFGKDLLLHRDPHQARHRWRCLTGKEPDPFNTFDHILALKQRYPHTTLLFFALLANYGPFDKNISHNHEEFRQLLKHLADYVRVGIHTSYASHSDSALIETEVDRLNAILHHNVTRNRAHFLLMSLPATYRQLLLHGIQHDYTMGYADMPGFRAGISVPYPFFDLYKDAEEPLLIHPFCLMDVTLHTKMGLSNDESESLFRQMIDKVADVGGTFSCIVHNQYLCNLFGWQGWSDTFDSIWAYGANKAKAASH